MGGTSCRALGGCSANVCWTELFTELPKEKSAEEHSSTEGTLQWPWVAGGVASAAPHHRGIPDVLTSPLPETCHSIC